MDESKKPKAISRRKFIKGVGTGIVGTYVVPSALSAIGKEEKKGPKEDWIPISLTVNGKKVRVKVEPRMTLAELLREELELTGTKVVCNRGECGGCTVVLDGKAVYSCHILALDADGKEVLTVEGLMQGEALHPLQEAFWEKDGLQCGFCTPGQIMAAYALLKRRPRPSVEEIKEGMSGNLCRCAAYPKIIESVQAAAEKMAGRSS